MIRLFDLSQVLITVRFAGKLYFGRCFSGTETPGIHPEQNSKLRKLICTKLTVI